MSALHSLASLFRDPAHAPEAYVGPSKPRLNLPNDIDLQLDFPESITSAPNKVLYTLWKEGDQNHSNLLLLTGLSNEELRSTLGVLISNKKVITNKLSQCGACDDLYRLAL